MKKSLIKSLVIFDSATFLALGSDQLAKYFVLNKLEQPFIVFENILKFIYQENTGVAFGVNIPPVMQIILFLILIPLGFYLVVTYTNYRNVSVAIVSGLIFGGALSNFIDRIVHGHVIDFISVSIWPVFNLADIFITGGIFFLIIFYDRIKKV